MTYQLGVLQSHPIQYFAPLFRRLASEPDIDLTVFYCSRQGVESYEDEGFGGVEVEWDVPLLDGYENVFLENFWGDRGVRGFWSLLNPGIFGELRDRDPDALWIHGHNHATYLIAVASALALDIRLFMRAETHLLLDRPHWKELVRRPVMAAFYSLFDACLPIGAKNYEFYRHHGVPDEKLFLVPYTVNNEFFRDRTLDDESEKRQFLRDEGLDPDRSIILFASKMSRRKRPDDLLKVFERLEQNAQLVFVGDGEMRDQLEAYAEENYISDVHFVGFRNQTELPEWYSISDVFVLPSENEPWGLIINEVMNAGVPVMSTTDVGAVYDLIDHGETGYVYEPGDVETLSKLLDSLLADEEKRKKMGERAFQRIKNWSIEETVQGVRQALAETVGKAQDE